MSVLAGAVMLMLYWLGPARGLDPGQRALVAGAAALVLGTAIFLIARGGRTWPAWALLIALVTGTFAAGQTAESWLPTAESWLANLPTLRTDEDSPEEVPGLPVAVTLDETAKTEAQADAKTGAEPDGKASKAEIAEETQITAEQFLMEHIEPALKAISAYEGYSCNFHKREWAKPLVGNNYRLTDEKISLKVRHEPFSAYLHFDHEAKRGTEALYVEGKNDGNVVAHSTVFPSNLVGTIRVPPTDRKVMADNRYPITNIGMKNLMIKFKKESEENRTMEKDITFTLVKDQKVDGRPCKVIEIYNAKPEKYSRASARLYIDREWGIPVGFESYEKMDGRTTLVEYYRYTNLKFNPGFKDIDFDPANPAYGYRR
jgi:hypothetical protein